MGSGGTTVLLSQEDAFSYGSLISDHSYELELVSWDFQVLDEELDAPLPVRFDRV